MFPVVGRPNGLLATRHGKRCFYQVPWTNNKDRRGVVASAWWGVKQQALSTGTGIVAAALAPTDNGKQNQLHVLLLVLTPRQQQKQHRPEQPRPPHHHQHQHQHCCPSSRKESACYCCGPTVYDDAHLGMLERTCGSICFDGSWNKQYAAAAALSSSSSSSSSSSINSCSTPPPPPPPPLLVMNITDVDDKILKAAAEDNARPENSTNTPSSPLDYARHYERKFWTDMDALNCLRPHVVVRVSEHVEDSIIPYIQTLIDKGMAYQQYRQNHQNHQQQQLPDEDVDGEDNNKINDNNSNNSSTNDEQGGVLFDVAAFEQAQHTYGKLVPNLRRSSADSPHDQDDTPHSESVQSACSVTGSVLKKKDARDFALWKERKNGEALFWESPWGAGRPGWHIECSAMIESISKQFPSHEFMVHAGGIDLKFPHHTNEIAQAEAYHHHHHHRHHHHHHHHDCCSPRIGGTGSSNGTDGLVEWIPHWMHMGHLHIGGLKMSKSLKNFITIESKRKDNAEWADNFRLWCLALSGSYRDATTYSEDRMEESRNVRAKLVRFLVGAQSWVSRRKEGDFTSNRTLQWHADDMRLFEAVTVTRTRLQNALLDDLNGAACLDALLSLIERANDTIVNCDDARHEPMEAAVQLVRTTLQLLGFHKQTYEAGLRDSADQSVVVHDRKVVLDEFTKFRSTVRRAAIADHQNRAATSNMNCILEACDRLRDKTFPSMGVELIDRSLRAAASSGEDTDEWQYCVQHTNDETATQLKTPPLAPNVIDNLEIEPHLLFHSGSYIGQFSDFDEAGIPTTLADGSPVSKSQTKKLRKLLEKYERKHEERRS